MCHYLPVLVVLTVLQTKHTSAAKYTERQCITACENSVLFRHLWLRRQCNSCIKDPPIGVLLCSHAISQSDNKYFRQIADSCVTLMKPTDKLCIIACKNQENPRFREICAKCNIDPPMSADMCIFACGNTENDGMNMMNVCFQCSIRPPRSAKLCRYACQRTRNNYYRGMCSSSVCSDINQQ